MSRNEIKEKIFEIIDKIDDHKLMAALQILQNLEQKGEYIQLSSNIKQVLEEDKELLKRLAQ